MNIESKTAHTLLKPTTTIEEVNQLCREAIEHKFRSVCVPPLFVKKVKEQLKDVAVKTATVAGFPYGYSAIEAKLAETVLAIVDGADEIELVINMSALKNADWQYLAKEINTILPVIKSKGRITGVILETSLLTEKEMITCCDIYGAAGVDFIKTATGILASTEQVETVSLIRKHLADQVKITTGGLINNFDHIKELLSAGADCISMNNSIAVLKSLAV